MVTIYEKNPLTCLIAQDIDQDQGWGKSERPRETIWPLLQATTDLPNISNPLQLRLYTKSQLRKMTQEVLNDFRDQTVIISWSHQQIPELALLFGVDRDQVPIKWEKNRFDVTWVVDTNTKQLQQYPQMLMYGDLTTIIS